MSEEALRRIAENKQTQHFELDLSECDLIDLPAELLECVWVTKLSLRWSVELVDLSALSALSGLQHLDCSGTSVADLSALSALSGLQHLNCSRTSVADLSALSGLSNLQHLDCSGTSVADLSALSGLSDLQHLDCSGTSVADLSALSALSGLQSIDCSGTSVADLSPIKYLIKDNVQVIESDSLLLRFVRSKYLSGIYVGDCPLICPPIEIAQDSPEAVVDYFEELGEDGRNLNEVKIIFLGEASAGKTSLVKQLMGEAFDLRESQTHGIRIRKVPFTMPDGDAVTAHLWDFGGQEVMHATHQFFLSQRSVYVLLLNSRNDDQAEKWLKHAESFGGRSPVLVVLNKIDENPSFEVERKSLQEKYPQIQGFFRLSCAENNHSGFVEFKEALRQQIDRSDTRRTPFPARWLAVKNHFADMTADYIEAAEFRRVCERHGVARPLSQDVLLQFLHDLGVVINFRNLQNFDTQILNPLWLTNGVYRIINSGLVAESGGLLKEADFDAVINDSRYQTNDTSEQAFHYPKHKLQYIVRVMQEFELCFMLDTQRYVVPQLLPANASDFQFDGAVLKFVIHFPDLLPSSVFPRLMVKLHTFIRGADRWRTGMVLHKPTVFQASARVRWDKEDQKLLLDVCGEERRRFLSFIRETVKEIVADFANLNFTELVPIPDGDAYKDYDELVCAEQDGEEEVYIKELRKRVKIADLLDGVEEAVMRDEEAQKPIKAFVSYSHADLEHLKALQAALSPLVRLEKLQLWDDRSIDAGTDWRETIFQHLAAADVVLCLVSPDFVKSDFCYQEEFSTALLEHNRGEKVIVPIRLRSTDWDGLRLRDIQGVPGVWVTSAGNKDEAWTEVSVALRRVLEQVKARKRAE
ncbi:COR domain-containing protein [Methylovulum psychrotolerans]|uniref:non-specific serine/threonine protein kinase n=1 Tax=Methylovulum psychrotolerans TaxID=1704499 RepID=A0A1Z4C3V6_9GAMM|nr:COR domain-containing protein [Methylovulum psychrotolerans]ASF48190.1 GTP-binding protein [Methylovulum psychrotolerans]